MPLPGGPSDKAGNSYERRWAVLALTDVLLGRFESIRFEVPGPAGEGFEFRVRSAGLSEWHQVKRQRSGGDWSIAALMAEGVLQLWPAKLLAGERCVFVSGTGARELNELVERAVQAASWEEFSAYFLQGESNAAFQRLQVAWCCSGPEVHLALKMVDVHIIDESQLTARVADRLRLLVVGDSDLAAAALERHVDESVHQELTASDVWDRLEGQGFAPRHLFEDAAVARAVAETADSLVARQSMLYIGGQELSREESGMAFDHLADGKRVLLAGGAGSGKSVVVSQVIRKAGAEGGWPVLALSADDIPGKVESAGEWGAALGMPDSPVTVLAGLSRGGEGLLVVDQVDAVGSVSGRHPERRKLVEEVLRQAASHPEIRVLVACRQFDLDHDRILRGIAVDDRTVAIAIGELDEQTVRQVLARTGTPADLPTSVVPLLRMPLHLALHVDLVGSPADLSKVGSLDDLYRSYCDEKRRSCREARGGSDDWQEVVDVLVERMDATQELWAPAAVLNDLHHQRDVMTSAGVLISDGSRIKFFHETLFDHCFAERLVAKGQTLHDLLGSNDQDLFRRAQVRQVLSYRRSTDFSGYLADVDWLLTSPEVRSHLKVLVVALTQTTPDPTPQEWRLLRPIAVDPTHLLHQRLWNALRRNPAWFPLIGREQWERWLASHDTAVVNRTVWALALMATTWPEETATLMRGLPDGASRDGWLRMFLQFSDVHHGRALLELMLDAITSGLFDADGTTTVWETTRVVAAHQPAWAVELLQALMARMIMIEADTRVEAIFRAPGPWSARRGFGGEEAITTAAREAPEDFVDRLMPLAVELMRRQSRGRDGVASPLFDRIWGVRYFESQDSLLDDLFAGLEESLAQMAQSEPDRADVVFERLRRENLESGWILLARGYAGNPARFADQAVEWLISSPGSLDLGFTDSPYWVTRELIGAISPHCSKASFERLCDSLLYFTPDRERTYRALKRRGWGELCLLNGLSPARRPERVERRLAELRRKFLRDDVCPPQLLELGLIPPPIPEERASRMTDAQWMRAIVQHGDSVGSVDADRRWVGDAWQQAQVLEELTKQDPLRFARLLLRMPSGGSLAYVCGILRGISGMGLDQSLLIDVVKRARESGASDVNQWVAWLVDSEAAGQVPDELLSIISDIAINDPDPEDDSWWTQHDEDPESAGLNCTRGAAACAIASLLRQNPTRLDRLKAAVAALVTDKTVQVRVMAIRALLPVLDIDRDTALDLFHVCVDVRDHRLLAARSVETFLNRAIHAGHYLEVADVLGSMISSQTASAQRAGARQLTSASSLYLELDQRVDELFANDDEQGRAGVVEAFAFLAREGHRPDRCLAVLSAGFDDPSGAVREAATHCFRGLEQQSLDERLRALTMRFLASSSFPEHAEALLLPLDGTTRPLPNWVLDVCERYVVLEGSAIGNLATRPAFLGHHLVNIVIRMHVQQTDSEVRRRCLDLIDHLLVLGAHDIDKELTSIER